MLERFLELLKEGDFGCMQEIESILKRRGYLEDDVQKVLEVFYDRLCVEETMDRDNIFWKKRYVDCLTMCDAMARGYKVMDLMFCEINGRRKREVDFSLLSYLNSTFYVNTLRNRNEIEVGSHGKSRDKYASRDVKGFSDISSIEGGLVVGFFDSVIDVDNKQSENRQVNSKSGINFKYRVKMARGKDQIVYVGLDFFIIMLGTKDYRNQAYIKFLDFVIELEKTTKG